MLKLIGWSVTTVILFVIAFSVMGPGAVFVLAAAACIAYAPARRAVKRSGWKAVDEEQERKKGLRDLEKWRRGIGEQQ